jgi:uncharacterized Zn finger protein
MCKHVAATLYGVGARLDHKPELLFSLRGVDPTEMVEAAIDQPTAAGKTRKGRVLETDELSSVFGVDIDMDGVSSEEASTPTAPAKRTQRAAKSRKPASSRDTGKKTAAIPATRRSAAAKKTAGKKKSTTAEATPKKAAAKKATAKPTTKKTTAKKPARKKAATKASSAKKSATDKPAKKSIAKKKATTANTARKKASRRKPAAKKATKR